MNILQARLPYQILNHPFHFSETNENVCVIQGNSIEALSQSI